MPSLTHKCEECLTLFTLKYKGKDEPTNCPFCGAHFIIGEEIEEDWDDEGEIEDWE